MSLASGRRYGVSLHVTSDTLSLRELQGTLGVTGDSGSRSRGDSLPGGRTARTTVLTIESALDDGAMLVEQLEAIRRRVPANRVRSASVPMEATFSIAMYFTTACGSVTIDATMMDAARDYSAAIEVVAYPASSEHQ